MNNIANKKYDLEDRLIEFAVLVIKIAENLKNTRAGNHIAGQIVRSGTSPSLNYGEAQSAESLSDFIHKFKILLKELRETRVALKIIKRVPLINDIELIDKGLMECNELISIVVKSIETAKKNTKKVKINRSKIRYSTFEVRYSLFNLNTLCNN